MLHLRYSKLQYYSDHRPSADLRYGGQDSISPSTLIFVAIESKLEIWILHDPLMYSQSLLWDEAKICLLEHVLSSWTGCLPSFRPSGQNMT